MTRNEVERILTAICDEHTNDSDDNRPNIEIMHGPANGYTVIDADFPAWELDDEILRAETSNGTRWIACESIHCIGV